MKKIITTLILLLFAGGSFAQEGDPTNGEKIFKANCSACHRPDKKLIGPPLKGVRSKYEDDIPYIHAFVNNSQEVINSGDPRAVKIYEENGKQLMSSFDLTEQEVIDVLAYADSFTIDEASGSGMKIRPLEPLPKSKAKPFYLKSNIGIWAVYFVGALILLVVLNQLSLVQDYLPDDSNKHNGKDDNDLPIV